MAINKVVYGDQTLVDLTSDTATAEDVAHGKTFHDASGQLRTGSNTGSGGHTIQNDSGTALPQESALQFVGAYSEDDSTNGKTKVNIIREMTKAQMDALSTDAKKGLIHTTDEPDNPANPISAEDVSYGDETVEQALNELQDDIIFANDTTKYNLPAVGTSIDVTKTVTPPTGYSLVGIINTSSGTSSTACMPLVVNGNAYITVLNVSNSGQVGTKRTMTWSNIFKKF